MDPESSSTPNPSPPEPASGQPVSRTYRRARLAFLVIFVVSTAAVLWLTGAPGRRPLWIAEGFQTNWASVVAVIAVGTSIASLLGTITTTILAWRKERRDTQAAELERERQRLEIERLKLQLERERTKDDNSAG